jgi:hypothetical protein
VEYGTHWHFILARCMQRKNRMSLASDWKQATPNHRLLFILLLVVEIFTFVSPVTSDVYAALVQGGCVVLILVVPADTVDSDLMHNLNMFKSVLVRSPTLRSSTTCRTCANLNLNKCCSPHHLHTNRTPYTTLSEMLGQQPKTAICK